LSRGDREAKARTSISRAYYAVYLEAKRRFFPPEANVKHAQIIRRVREEIGAEPAADLRNLYRMREKADYFIHEGISNEDAVEWVRVGSALLALVA
jgi:uncharacterized protein (UPF0332 family)